MEQQGIVREQILSSQWADVRQRLEISKRAIQQSREALNRSDELLLWFYEFGPRPEGLEQIKAIKDVGESAAGDRR